MNSDKPESGAGLVRRSLAGAPGNRVAVGPLAVHYCARFAGVSLADYTLKPAVMAECIVRYYERFRPDAVWVSADTWVTAEAMGAKVAFPAPSQPLGGTGVPAVRTAADVDRIPAPDPSVQGRYPIMLEAVRRVRAALGPDVFVVGCFDQYPFSAACALLGLETALLQWREDRLLLEALLGRGVEYAVAYGQALAQAGADMLSGGDSPAGLLGPDRYREIALPAEQRVIAGLKARVARPVSLHICGQATPMLAAMAGSGADVLELDHQVDLPTARRLLGDQIAVWGNLDPVALLAQATPAQVGVTTRATVRQAQACGLRRFVLSSGCTLAVETPAANLEAMFAAARNP